MAKSLWQGHVEVGYTGSRRATKTKATWRGSLYRVLAEEGSRKADAALHDVHLARARALRVQQCARVLVQHELVGVRSVQFKLGAEPHVLRHLVAHKLRRVPCRKAADQVADLVGTAEVGQRERLSATPRGNQIAPASTRDGLDHEPFCRRHPAGPLAQAGDRLRGEAKPRAARP